MFEKNPADPAPTRPAVVQRRGMERRQALLEAAEAVLGEQGYEAATLKAIGKRAGIPTASVYHYFSDRHQVDAEVLRNHVRELDIRITAALENAEPHTLRDFADAVIDPIRDYFREHPSCIELWFRGPSPTVTAIVRAFDEAQAERMWHLLVERELLSADTPQLALKLAFEAGARLFDVAFRDSPSGDDDTINETRRLINAYLETYAREAD